MRLRRTALAPRPLNASRPSLTVTNPRSPAGVGSKNETSSAVLATIDREGGTGSHSPVSSAMWYGVHEPAAGLGDAVT